MDGMYTALVECCYIGGDSLTADRRGMSLGLDSGGLRECYPSC